MPDALLFLPEIQAERLRRPGDLRFPADDGIHPGAIGAALGGHTLFLLAAWTGFAYGYQVFLLAVIVALSAMYFVPMIGLGQDAARHRGDTTGRSFRDFLHGRAATFTGAVRGRDALVQIAAMPLALGLAMGVLAVMWRCIR